MRAFLALEVQESVIQKLVEAQEELRKTQADLAVVDRQNLHLTVKFLGEIAESRVAEIDSRLKGLPLRSGDVMVKGVGVFPNLGRPRVVWAGVAREHQDRIVPLAEAVIRALDGIGEKDDRPYHAHATLARVRSGRNREGLASFVTANTTREFGVVHLGVLKLKSSTLTPQGPSYNDVREYQLA